MIIDLKAKDTSIENAHVVESYEGQHAFEETKVILKPGGESGIQSEDEKSLALPQIDPPLDEPIPLDAEKRGWSPNVSIVKIVVGFLVIAIGVAIEWGTDSACAPAGLGS